MFTFTNPDITVVKKLVFPTLYFTENKEQSVRYATARWEAVFNWCLLSLWVWEFVIWQRGDVCTIPMSHIRLPWNLLMLSHSPGCLLCDEICRQMIKVPLNCYSCGPVCSSYVLMWVSDYTILWFIYVTLDLFLSFFVSHHITFLSFSASLLCLLE